MKVLMHFFERKGNSCLLESFFQRVWLTMNVVVEGSFLLLHLLLVSAGEARGVLRHWITNRPKHHCCPESENQVVGFELLEVFNVEKSERRNRKLVGRFWNLNGMAYGLDDPVKDTGSLHFERSPL